MVTRFDYPMMDSTDDYIRARARGRYMTMRLAELMSSESLRREAEYVAKGDGLGWSLHVDAEWRYPGTQHYDKGSALEAVRTD